MEVENARLLSEINGAVNMNVEKPVYNTTLLKERFMELPRINLLCRCVF